MPHIHLFVFLKCIRKALAAAKKRRRKVASYMPSNKSQVAEKYKEKGTSQGFGKIIHNMKYSNTENILKTCKLCLRFTQGEKKNLLNLTRKCMLTVRHIFLC